MVKLLVGKKGSGKTKRMIDLANEYVDSKSGSIIFVNKNHRLTIDLNHKIRVVCMEEYVEIENIDQYTGFLFGLISSDHDLEVVFLDSLLKHDDIGPQDMTEFLSALAKMSEKYNIEFIVSLSADASELKDVIDKYEVLN